MTEIFKDELFNLWMLLAQTRETIVKARDKELRQYGISPRQAVILLYIRALGNGATITEVSRVAFRKPNSVFSMVERMRKAGLLTKEKDKKTKNLTRLSLTAKGVEVLRLASKREAIHEIFLTLDNGDREHLKLYLQILKAKAFQLLGLKDQLPFPPFLPPDNVPRSRSGLAFAQGGTRQRKVDLEDSL